MRIKPLIPAIVVLVVALVGIGATYLFSGNKQGGPEGPSGGVSEWIIYRNERYGFKLRYPADWTVSVLDESTEPKINIYPKDQNVQLPLTHHSNATHVSIFPKGIGTEGVGGRNATSTLKAGELTASQTDFMLEDGTPWGTYMTFKAPPASWQPWGFLWAGSKVEDLSFECVSPNGSVQSEDCGFGSVLGEIQLKVKGRVDPSIRAIERTMIESLRFTNTTEDEG